MRQKHRILFVDDDLHILKGISRASEEYTDFWETDYVSSGSEALEKLAHNNFDAIVTDMHMPIMNGLQLLEKVSKINPEVIRFVLSGNISEAQSFQLPGLVHQIIPKPSEIQTIYSIVEDACSMRDIITNPNLIKTITGIKSLPSLPLLYNRIMAELQRKEPETKIIGEIIAQDPGMTAKILQLVNSAFFGLADHVTSPQRAVSLLGLNTIKALVLGVQVFSEFEEKEKYPISIDMIWKHSIMVSELSSQIAKSLLLTTSEQDDARVAGILHDAGKLIQFRIPEFFKTVEIIDGNVSFESEFIAYGTTHAEMGGYLLGIWRIPTQIVEAVILHHNYPSVNNLKISIATSLYISNGIINVLSQNNEMIYDKYLDINFLRKMNLIDQLPIWISMAKNIIDTTTCNYQ
jgi:HD-like signal output (HDOD) protein